MYGQEEEPRPCRVWRDSYSFVRVCVSPASIVLQTVCIAHTLRIAEFEVLSGPSCHLRQVTARVADSEGNRLVGHCTMCWYHLEDVSCDGLHGRMARCIAYTYKCIQTCEGELHGLEDGLQAYIGFG